MLVHADPSDIASFERAGAKSGAARTATAADTATRESQVAMARDERTSNAYKIAFGIAGWPCGLIRNAGGFGWH